MKDGDAKVRARNAVADGTLKFSTHARQRMQERGLQAVDVEQAICTASLVKRSSTKEGEAWVFHGRTEEDVKLRVIVGVAEDGLVRVITVTLADDEQGNRS